MYKDTEGLQADTPKSRFMAEELHGLIDALQNLHSHISSLLASARIRPSKPFSGHRDSLNIADSLKEYIVKEASEPRAPGREPVHRNLESAQPKKEMSVGSAEHAEPHSTPHRQENTLSQYLSRKATDHDHHPDMSEKMRANTIEHIKKSIRLTKQGDVEGAKLNAELADSAMRTAIEYMTEDEYVLFREEVMRRLDALQETE